ncbi:MEKHLA domain-containing protein [Streptomyces griseoruber]|uniref:MEKHLA domain-containing protein n=1 Tax=Streptomyces griseoruber TaxID=1943 RepID=UPI003799177D
MRRQKARRTLRQSSRITSSSGFLTTSPDSLNKPRRRHGHVDDCGLPPRRRLRAASPVQLPAVDRRPVVAVRALSAAPEGQSDRAAFVRSVAERGYTSGYRGLRIAESGRRFWIEDVTMWNLVDADGSHHGRAAVFRSWTDVPEDRTGG